MIFIFDWVRHSLTTLWNRINNIRRRPNARRTRAPNVRRSEE